jgi:hypothetical protein
MKSNDQTISERWKGLLKNCDVTGDISFLVGSSGTPVRAHKCVVANSSPAFHAMLYGPMSEARTGEVR